jgi:hypothetical protein
MPSALGRGGELRRPAIKNYVPALKFSISRPSYPPETLFDIGVQNRLSVSPDELSRSVFSLGLAKFGPNSCSTPRNSCVTLGPTLVCRRASRGPKRSDSISMKA